jgi:hypothetical protein
MGGVKAAPIAGKVMQRYLLGTMPAGMNNQLPLASLHDTVNNIMNIQEQ